MAPGSRPGRRCIGASVYPGVAFGPHPFYAVAHNNQPGSRIMAQSFASSPRRPRIARATLVAGTLDILAAISLTLFYGKRTVSEMLAYVASGPFPGVPVRGLPVAVLGLAVHYALMAVMAAVYVAVADRVTWLKRQPVVGGIGYGLITYVMMNLIVVPLRFGVMPSTPAVVTQLFCHIVLVGLPIAFIARR